MLVYAWHASGLCRQPCSHQLNQGTTTIYLLRLLSGKLAASPYIPSCFPFVLPHGIEFILYHHALLFGRRSGELLRHLPHGTAQTKIHSTAMCLLNVKEEEDYSVPARYKRVSRVRRYSPPPSPPRSARVSRTHYVEERRISAPAPLPPPTIIMPPPAPPSVAPPPSVRETVRSRSRHTSRAPSVRAPSVRAPSVRAPSVTRSHYVEVDEDTTSSSSSSSEDVRSRATSHHSRKTSRSHKSAPPPPASEYSIHEREREIRRSRGYSKPRNDFETYRYIEAPPGRRSENYEPRESRDSVRRETRVVVEDGHGRRDVRYRR